MRAGDSRIRKRRKSQSNVAKRGYVCIGIARAEAVWRLHHAGNPERVRRRGAGVSRRGASGVTERLGKERRNISLTGGSGVHGRVRSSDQNRLSESGRQGGAI